MLRKLILGASALAMAPLAAHAQETMAPEADISTKAATAIIDATQVETRDEAKLYAESEFLQADQNDDGKLDQSEFVAYAAARAPLNDPALSIPDEVMETEKATPPATASAEASVKEPATAEEQFAEISKGDEAISHDELVETRVAQFDEADQNDDEALDETERMQFAALTKLKAPKSIL